ncbi:MAG: Tad domain-containing protein [Planctomycetota bacterium]|jgi:hypothetical protein
MKRSFLRDESGQSLAFAVLTFLIVILVAFMVLGVGEATSVQMELQNSADAAAYSGAQVMADCVAQIAWLNEAMARVYYHSMRYAVDTATLSVFAEMKEHPLWYGDAALWGQNAMPAFTLSPTNQQVWSNDANPVTEYNNAYATAEEWIPKGQEWLRRLSRLQRGIALLAPLLVERQVSSTAMENIYTGDIEDRRPSFCTFPSTFEFVPVGPTKRTCHLERIPDGWDIYDDEGFRFIAKHEEPEENEEPTQPDDLWKIVYESNGEVSKTIDITTWENPEPSVESIVLRHRFDIVVGEETHLVLVTLYEDGSVLVIQDGAETEINIYDGPPQVTEIIEPGNKITRIRHNSDGFREYWLNGPDGTDDNGNNISEDDEWIVPGAGGGSNSGGSTTTTIEGVEVPVSFNPNIGIGSPGLGTNMSIDIGPPVVLHLQGMHLTLTNPMNIAFNSPYGWLRVTDERASIHGLNTQNHDDGKWRRTGNHHWFWGNRDKVRHRLKEVVAEDIPTDTGEWLYEWVRIGSYMSEMSNAFFATHAIMDHDPYYRDKVDNEGKRYFGPTLNDDQAYQNDASTSRWRHFPRWARPSRLPAFEAALADPNETFDGDFGGWFSLDTGKPHDLKAYSQTRVCWGCAGGGWQPSAMGQRLHDYDDDLDNPTTNLRCVRPAGFIYHVVEPGTYTSVEEMENQLRTPINSAMATAGLGIGGAGAIFEITDKTVNGTNLGTLATQDGFKDGSLVFQVACPVCLRKAAAVRDYWQGPPFAPPATSQNEVPAVVRKYLAHGFGRYSRSGPMPNRSVNYNASPNSAGDENYISVPAAVTFQQARGGTNPSWLKPLQATSELFRNGLTVAVWKEAVEDRFFEDVGRRDATLEDRRRGLANPLKSPSWGHFGIATARLVFWNYDYEALRDDNGNGSLDAPSKAVTFPWSGIVGGGSRPGWIDETEEEIDIIERPVHWHRQMWLRSHANLFNPDWDARIIPVKHALNVKDLYTVEEIDDGLVEDSGVSYLMRMIRGGRWRASPIDSGYGQHNVDPRVQGDWGRLGINFTDPDVENVIRH